jgi:hypothetical protein
MATRAQFEKSEIWFTEPIDFMRDDVIAKKHQSGFMAPMTFNAAFEFLDISGPAHCQLLVLVVLVVTRADRVTCPLEPETLGVALRGAVAMPLDPRLQMAKYFFRCHIDFEAFDHDAPRRRILQEVRSRESGAFLWLSAKSLQDLRWGDASWIGELAMPRGAVRGEL